MKSTVNGLAQGVMTVGLVVAIFFALTMSVNLWLATSSHNPANTVVMAHPTPDPHP